MATDRTDPPVATCQLDDVLITHELAERPSRLPDYAAEARALRELAWVLATNPGGVLRRLCELVIELCHCDSSSVSILEPGGERDLFRWHAIAGALAPNLSGSMPHDASLCGTVVASDQVLLFREAEPCFPGLRSVEPHIYENLIAPWHAGGKPVGMLWAIKHTPEGHFEREDARLLGGLSRFAAAARRTISALERAEALLESEVHFRAIVEEATDYAIFTTDSERRLEAWPPGAQAVFGWSEAEAVGQPFDITFTPADRAAGEPERECVIARETGAAPDVRWHVRKDGSAVFIEGVSRGRFGKDGAFLGLLKIGRDVTERQHAETALRESEARFRAVANLVPDLLWQSAPDGSTEWYNDRWYAYTGQEPNEAAGWGWLDAIHPEDRAAAAAANAAAAAGGTPLTLEHRIRSANGAYRWFLVRVEPVRDANGHLAAWFGAATDIHEERVARDELQARVTDSTVELRTLSRRVLEVQEEERRHIARELHDEIGQVLTGLGLQLGAVQTTDVRVEEAQRIVRELTEQVRQLSMDLRPAALDAYGLLPTLQLLLARYQHQTGVAVELRQEGADRRFSAQVEVTVYRVVQEALTNVARHAEATAALVQLYADAVTVTISVRDDGRGFDPEATASAGGLAGLRERVELLGGSIAVDAAPGAGTTVTAELPLTEPAATDTENAT